MSLRRRMALVVGGLVAFLVVAAGLLNWWLASSSLRGSVDKLLAEQADSFVSFGRGLPQRFDGVPPPGAPDRLNERAIRFQIIMADGQVFGSEDLPIDPAVVAEVAESSGEEFHTVDLDGRPFRVLTRQVGEDTLQLGTDIEPIQTGLTNLRRGLLLGGLGGVIVAGLVGWFAAERLTKPIVEVTAAAAYLAAHNELPEPIPVERGDEVGQLANSFNELVAALALSRDQQARLVADASHELRTPLTSLRMKIEFLVAEPHLATEQRQEIVQGAAAELEAFGALVSELVDLASNSSAEEELQRVDLGAVAEEAAQRARLTTHRSITVSTTGTEVMARPTMVRRALSNLIDNAHKYSPADQPIEIHERNGGIAVRDHGPGIAPEDRRYAFDRFFRSAGAQTEPGSGIGLAIVKNTAEAHGGTVWVEEAAGGGAVVGFSIGPPSH